MIVDIISFREYKGYKVKIPNSGITLLNGVSGSGKTTILRAIRWCLYGGSAFGEKYEVRLKYKEMVIIRKSKPNAVEVRQNGETAIGDIATQIITNVFGPEDLFELCCYMKQGDSPCPILSPINKERSYFLSKLAFRDEKDPVILLEALSMSLKEAKLTYKKHKETYDDHVMLHDAFLSEVVMPSDVGTYQISEIVAEIKKLDDELHEITTMQISQSQLEARVSQINQQQVSLRLALTQRKTELETIRVSPANPEFLEEKRDSLETMAETIRNSIGLIDSDIKNTTRTLLINEWIAARASLPAKIPLTDFTDRDLYTLEVQHRDYMAAKASTEAMGISYDEIMIREELDALKKITHYIQEKTIYREYSAVVDKLETLPQGDPLTLKEEEIKLIEMKRSLDLLSCPHCDNLVRWKGGKLIAGDSKVGRVNQTHIVAQEQLIAKLTLLEDEKRRLTTKINFYKEKGADKFVIRESFEKFISTGPANLDTLIHTLMKIKVLPKPNISLEMARGLLAYYNTVRKLKASMIDIPSPDTKPVTIGPTLLPDVLNRLKNENMTKLRNLETNISSIAKEIKELRAKNAKMRDDIVRTESMIMSLGDQIEKATIELSASKASQEECVCKLAFMRSKAMIGCEKDILVQKIHLVKRYEELGRKQEAILAEKIIVDDLMLDVIALTDLYDTALLEHQTQLQDVVDSINACIAHGVDALFPYPLTIALDLMQPAPDEEKRYKQQVGFTIMRKGKDKSRRNPEDIFSGGEMKRLILLVVIALNTLYKAPILMLDEMFASLDPEFREECLAVTKRYINDRIILSAEHYAEVGDYDYSVDVMPTNAD